jgi:integrase
MEVVSAMNKDISGELEKGVRYRNGKYSFRYDIEDPVTGGRRQKETEGYASMKELKPVMIQIQAALLNDSYFEYKNIKVKDWVEKFLELYASSGKVKGRTVDARRSDLKKMTKVIGGMKLRDVELHVYQDLLNGMKEKHSRKTIEGFHAAATLLFKKAIQMKIIKENPIQYAEIPILQKTVEDLESEKEVPKFLEKEELAKLLKTASEMNDPQSFHALLVLSYTGMRLGELCALKTTDIDKKNKTISITKTLNDKKGIKNFELSTPKTITSKRKIDVSDTVLKILDKQETWRKEFKMLRRNEYYNGDSFVFVNDGQHPGWPARLRIFEKFMKDALVAAELPTTLTPHSLRHTYTSLMAEAGVELEAIQRLLGHSNNEITRKVYLHVTQVRKKEAVEKLDALMSGLL